MNNLEKMLFIEITTKQADILIHPEYNETLKKLTEDEKDIFYELCHQIHTIWNDMNVPKSIDNIKQYKSFKVYIEENEVSPIIVKIAEDFNLDFKDTISAESKKFIIEQFGKKYFDDNFGMDVKS